MEGAWRVRGEGMEGAWGVHGHGCRMWPRVEIRPLACLSFYRVEVAWIGHGGCMVVGYGQGCKIRVSAPETPGFDALWCRRPMFLVPFWRLFGVFWLPFGCLLAVIPCS